MVDDFSAADLPDSFVDFKYPLLHLAAALRKAPVRIVAMGSSSTAGREDVVPYPHRLEMYLRRDTGNAGIDVINRGRGGEEADRELCRFDSDIFAEAPSLVIWQVGTNAVFRNNEFDFEKVVEAITTGLDRIRSQTREMDVMLMDPQYVPAMLFDDKADLSERIVARIAAVAERAEVNVFRRWALMRHWHVHNNIGLDRMIDPTDRDRLHQSDGSTLRLSRGLSDAIRKASAGAT